jgi:hypothetical protein
MRSGMNQTWKLYNSETSHCQFSCSARPSKRVRRQKAVNNLICPQLVVMSECLPWQACWIFLPRSRWVIKKLLSFVHQRIFSTLTWPSSTGCRWTAPRTTEPGAWGRCWTRYSSWRLLTASFRLLTTSVTTGQVQSLSFIQRWKLHLTRVDGIYRIFKWVTWNANRSPNSCSYTMDRHE